MGPFDCKMKLPRRTAQLYVCEWAVLLWDLLANNLLPQTDADVRRTQMTSAQRQIKLLSKIIHKLPHANILYIIKRKMYFFCYVHTKKLVFHQRAKAVQFFLKLGLT